MLYYEPIKRRKTKKGAKRNETLERSRFSERNGALLLLLYVDFRAYGSDGQVFSRTWQISEAVYRKTDLKKPSTGKLPKGNLPVLFYI